MQRSLRAACNVRLGTGARAAAAIELLNHLEEYASTFGADQSSAGLELLTVLHPKLDSIEILEQLALAQLQAAHMQVVEMPDVNLGARLVSLAPLPGTSREQRYAGMSLNAVRSTLTKALHHLMDRAPRGFPTYAASECSCGVRVLQLVLALPIGGAPLGTPGARIQFFDGLGLDMWNALLRRASRLQAPIESKEGRYGTLAQAAWLQHLRGQFVSSALPARWDAEDIEPGRRAGLHVVVTAPIPPATDRPDREQLQRYEVLRQPLPVARLPELEVIDDIERSLGAEFPWALNAVKALVGELRTRRLFGSIEMGMAPTLFVGPPGCGKSRLARRLSELLNLPFRAIPCGGAHEAKPLLGTTRGCPSPCCQGCA